MTRRSLAIAVASIGVAILGGGAFWLHMRSSPAYAIKQLRAAVRERNRLKFERYFDLTRFANTAIEEVFARITTTSMDESESGFAFLGTVVAANALQNIKPALTTQFRSLILKGVENGKLDSALTGTEDTSLAMNLAVVARNISADRIEIGEITNIKQEGATATADLPIRNMLLDTTLVLRLRLEKGDDAWRVVAPDNLSEYLEIVDRLQEQRLSEANERARQAMQDIVSVSDVRRSVRKYYYLNDDLILATTLRNIGRDTITAVVFNTYVNGKEMDPSDGWLIYFHTITPGASAQISRTYDYNPYMDSHQLLRYGSITVQPFLIVRRIAGRPDTLMRFNTWSDYAERQ